MIAAERNERKLTAVQIILLSADELAANGTEEFSEWELTVAAWNRNRERFGLRGFHETYPDHKRVMMEIMGNKTSNPILQKFMEKTRPNYYRLTSMGRIEAGRLRSIETGVPQKGNTMRDLFDRVSLFAGHAVFARWRDEPSEPEKWKDAALFLGVKSERNGEAAERHQSAHNLTRAAIDWCMAQKMTSLPQGTHRNSPAIQMKDLSDLQSFLQALKYRFPDQLDKRRPSRN